jgi:hypothetical protein|tara:strand:- start:2885 stop:3178 length:294 start_codon:yes stop_codon:yes gene_type:complete
MTQTFVVLYSILTYIGGTGYEEAISHGVQFGSYIDCNYFYQQNYENLQAGVIDYAERRYGAEMELNEIGCVTMTIDMTNPSGENNTMSDYRTLWSLS